MKQKLVVIGAGMASGRVLEHLTEPAPDAFDITLINAKPRGNYNRIMLSPVLSGENAYADFITHDDDWYAPRGGNRLGQGGDQNRPRGQDRHLRRGGDAL